MLQTILIVLCLVSILKGTIQYYYFKRKKENYYRTTGIIVDNYKDEDYSYRHYYPIVEYTDRNGETVQIQSDNYNSDLPMYEVGTKVPILVNPDDNTRVLFDEKADELTIPLIWIGIGVIGLLICCFYLNDLPF